jgi:hypothetical protein
MLPIRITQLRIENFRSIQSMTLEEADLGPVVVLYGKNGAGKSNILAAMERFWRVLGLAMQMGYPPETPYVLDQLEKVLTREDVYRVGLAGRIRLGVRIVFNVEPLKFGDFYATEIDIQLLVEIPRSIPAMLHVEKMIAKCNFNNEEKILEMQAFDESHSWLQKNKIARESITNEQFAIARVEWRQQLYLLCEYGFLSIPAMRELGQKKIAASDEDDATIATRAAMTGDLALAFSRAHNSLDFELRSRLDAFKKLLSGPPLHRPELTSYIQKDRSGLVEIHYDQGRPFALPIDQVGLGLQQVYAILGAILLSKAPIVTIEEPEAHLHAPTTGLQLRALLLKIVEGDKDISPLISQIFIASHTTLFDLNPKGYLEVTHDMEHGTKARRYTDLVRLDRNHAYELGAARHALMDALRLSRQDRIAFRRPDGSAITTSEMLVLLANHDPIAIEYLEDVTSAAVRAVALKAEELS